MAIIRDKVRKFMLEPHLEWAEGQYVPLPEDFAIEMLAIDTKPRAGIGARGAICYLKGRGDVLTTVLYELAPGAANPSVRGAARVLASHQTGCACLTVRNND
jgi:hypothetical protein